MAVFHHLLNLLVLDLDGNLSEGKRGEAPSKHCSFHDQKGSPFVIGNRGALAEKQAKRSGDEGERAQCQQVRHRIVLLFSNEWRHRQQEDR